jgi:lipoprotein signal peptidase
VALPRRRMGLLLAVAAIVLAADITSKVIVVAVLSDRPPLRLLGGLLTLRVSRNSGAAFSIGTSMTIVFTAIAVGVIIFILRTSRRIRSVPWAIMLGLLLGGATGNLTDRLFRSPGPLRGWVVDWIQVPHWPVFNLADSAIVCGCVLAAVLAARGLRLDGTRLESARGRRGGSGAAPASQASAGPPGHGVAPGQGAEPGVAAGQAPAADRPEADHPWGDHPAGGGSGA